MTIAEQIYLCRGCGSRNLIKNGKNRDGNQQYFCKACQKSGVLNPKNSYIEAQKEHILAAYRERPRMRVISQIYGISRSTLARWLQKKVRSQPTLKETLLPAHADGVLELDELWSFLRLHQNKR